jgi:hypothetical protein
MASKTPVLDFIMDVSKDPKKLKELKNEPDKVMSSAGLTSAQAEILKSMNPERIRELLRTEAGAPLSVHVITAVAVFKF